MQNFNELAKLFEDRSDIEHFYETKSFIRVKNGLNFILENETKQIIFLIGEPGSGKSMFLNRLNQFYPNKEIIKFDTPFFEPVDFIKTLIEKGGKEVSNYSLEELIKEAINLYQNRDILIAIDEAQLLTKEMVELIRILCDTKAFWFILAMHKHESKKILKEPQFSSRPHRILEFGKIEFGEMREYIESELLRAGFISVKEQFKSSLFKLIYRYSKGNFRDLKKILNRLFLIMAQAKDEGLRGYERVNGCLITMAAIDGGLIDA